MARSIVAVTGGKGGTGKTMVAVNLACALVEHGHRVLLVDVDCSNPCTYLYFNYEELWSEDVTVYVPKIDEERCRKCYTCVAMCPEHALAMIPGKAPMVLKDLCAGCGTCLLVCPYGVVTESRAPTGKLRFLRVGEKLDLLVSVLEPGSRRNVLVSQKCVEKCLELSGDYDYVVVDTPAGTGADVYVALRASDKIIVVAEPTQLGLSDLEKLARTMVRAGMDRRVALVVNKAGISPEIEMRLCSIIGCCLQAKIPFDPRIHELNAKRELLLRSHEEAAAAIQALAEFVEQ